MQIDPNQTAMALLSTTASHGRGLGAISIAFSMDGMYGDGLNLYQYLRSNPWLNSDPLGLSSDPFAEIDAIIDEHIGSISGFASAIGAELVSTAIVAARIASYLPFPGVGLAGDLALVALGEQSLEGALMGAAIGIIPGGKLVKLLGKSGIFKGIGRLGSSAFGAAKKYAAQGAGFLANAGRGLFAKAKKWRGRKGKISGSCGCFTATTLVWTAHGAVPIGEIEQGQEVLAAPDDGLAADYASNDVGTKIVIGEASLVQLLLEHADGSTESIDTTDEHPFHVSDTNAWTRADQLEVGDYLSTISGTAKLLGVTYTTDRVPVYNLSIPGSPTYYVGEHGVWVHNCPTMTDLYNSTRKLDRNGMTFAGRALQKHGSRPGSAWKTAAKKAGDLNADADWQVLEILTNPASIRSQARNGRVDILHPDGRGIRFNSDGSFYAFLN